MEAIDFLKEKGIENPLEGNMKTQKSHMKCGCPGSMVMEFGEEDDEKGTPDNSPMQEQKSELRQWPVQLMLVPPNAPFLDGADLLISADCVPFAAPGFHREYLKGRRLLVGCPKLDDIDFYKEKLTEIFRSSNIKSITVLHMQVPCCISLKRVVEEALDESGKKIDIDVKVIPVGGKE